jgi:hypothetical protein
VSDAHDGPSKQDYRTPLVLLDAIRDRFNIARWDFDLACTSENCVAEAGYMHDLGHDSLTQDWSELEGLTCFLNPPFSDGKSFARKCAGIATGGPKVYALFLASLGSTWFAQHVRPHASTLILTGRVKFVGCETGFDRDLILCAYDGVKRDHAIELWDWREQGKGSA